MKYSEIDELKAGSETDLLVLKDIFALDPTEGEDVPAYTANPCDALDVAQLLSGSVDWDEYPFEIHRNYAHRNEWTASFGDYQFEAQADTFALAIIRAAMKVVHAEDLMECGHPQASSFGNVCLECE